MRFLTFLGGMTPWHLKCAGCGAKLKIGRYRRRSCVAASLYCLIWGGGCFWLYQMGQGRLFLPVGAYLVGVVIGEALFYGFLMGAGVRLELRQPSGS
jgi:hypothetical protein